MAAQGEQGSSGHITGVCTERNRLYDIGRIADAAAGYERYPVADSFVPESLVNGCQRQFDRDTDMIPDSGRGGSGAAAESVNGDDIGAASGNPACNGSNVMYSGYLYDNGFFVCSSLF